ncbi:MAG TPA: hypothetical protein DCL54_17985 [Alphaproteobacteria bacterium]|nr:hypothetical protein [Alphaproteobacteria bacterium]HAJ48470.1 hypothetical protein [Alphaproteobacteria bacterium]
MRRKRQSYIPVRKRELMAALAAAVDRKIAQPALFRRMTALLGAIIHHEYYDELETLKDTYALFEKSHPADPAADAKGVQALRQEMQEVLRQANFDEISPDDLSACEGETKQKQVRTKAPRWHYEEVRFFSRGMHIGSETVPRFFGLFSRQQDVEVYDDVVLYVRFRKDDPKDKSQRPLPAGAVPGTVLMKAFHDIPVHDICLLYPDIRIQITRADAFLLGAPALAGAVPILLNILPALSVIFVLGGAFLGYEGTVSDSQMKQAIGALAVLFGAGAFAFRQYSNYTFKKLKYQKRVADNVYFRNASNNAGVFESLIGAAEEQDTKEALIAYMILVTQGTKTQENLDSAAEDWLRRTFKMDIDFEIGDALAKLERLKLVTRAGPYLTAVPVREGLARLAAHWDNIYDAEGREQTA